jgi:hypothetical protein
MPVQLRVISLISNVAVVKAVIHDRAPATLRAIGVNRTTTNKVQTNNSHRWVNSVSLVAFNQAIEPVVDQSISP